MFRFLKSHPFAMEAFFDFSIVLSFAIPKSDVEAVVPRPLELDLHNNQFAFYTIAIVKVKNMRPKGWSEYFGQQFHLIGERIFVQYINTEGKRKRGLYILNSRTDRSIMQILGNLYTNYNYDKTSIGSQRKNDIIQVKDKDFEIKVRISDQEISLPPDSVFSTWKEARRFAGPLPFTFSVDARRKEMLIIEGARDNWIPIPIEILSIQFDLGRYKFLQNAKLSNAFIVENVPYSWKKGVKEKWS